MIPTMEELRELKKKYPDVKICTHPECKLTVRQHEEFYKYEQEKEDAKKTGKILTYYTLVPKDGKIDWDNPKEIHKKWDGEKWVEETECCWFCGANPCQQSDKCPYIEDAIANG